MRLDGSFWAAVFVAASALWGRGASAAEISADASNYRQLIGTLQPGDTLHLAAGTYTTLLSIDGLNGSSDAWITITGPESGAPAVFEADPGPCCNTIEISDSSYVAVRNLTVDGKMVDGAFGVSAKSGAVHHIRIERLSLIHHDTSQQNVGISTKVPTWGWEIRENRIIGVGTGMYLGNSDGTQPFIGGLIENNLIQDPIGYCMEIKWQQPRPDVAGMPAGPSSTIIRNNVFIKNDQPSPDGDRPNLLVGGFPDSGSGSSDLYEIYGNLFYHNPREALLQASGRVAIHDNVFVDAPVAALVLVDHDLPLRLAHVYNNTIYAANTGIRFGSSAREADAVIGNLLFSDTAITGSIANQSENLTDTIAAANAYVDNPSLALGAMSFYPLAGACEGPSLDLSSFSAELDYDRDFNGTSKGSFTFRGAYAGDGQNPGFQLTDDIKPRFPVAGTGGTPGAGMDAAVGASGGASSAGAGGIASRDGGFSATTGGSPSSDGSIGNSADGSGEDGACACRSGAQRRPSPGAAAALLLVLLAGLQRFWSSRGRHYCSTQ